MFRVIAFVGVALALFVIPVSATIIHVPGDYPTIQVGINASEDGDTVLVDPETYVENIKFNGHNVVLASLYLTTDDTSYISSTIIDGNQSGSVITFNSGEDSTAKLVGFGVPLDAWFRDREGLGRYLYLFTEPRFKQRGYLNVKIINNLVEEHLSEKSDHGEILWELVNLELWSRIFWDHQRFMLT